jgi:GTPase SAR1 family protein
MKNSRAAIICFDLTNEESYDRVPRWIYFVTDHSDDAMIIVAGNKLDLNDNRRIDYQVATAQFQELEVRYFEVSAKTGENVENMFYKIGADLISKEEHHNVEGRKKKDKMKVEKEVKSEEQSLDSTIKKLTKESVENEIIITREQCC